MSEPPTSAAARVEAAIEHHRAGRLAEAERDYRAALEADPGQARAAHNLGVLLQRDRLDEALAWFAAAAAADPQGPWWTAQVKALVRAGRFAQGEAVLAARGELTSEVEALEAELRQRWAFSLMRDGELAEAEAQFLRLQAISPDDPHVLADLGFVQLQQGRHEAARDTLEAALALAPQDVRTLVNLGTALLRLGEREAAEARYREALALDPQNSAARLNLKTLGAEAPAADTAAKASAPRADTLADLGRLDEALVEYLEAAKASRSPEALRKIGTSLAGMGRFDEALAWLDEAVALAPEDPANRYERSFARLATGDFARGWDDYEERWGVDSFRPSSSRIPEAVRGLIRSDLDRASVRGADVLLVAEQGVGDEIMFSSMIPDLAADAKSVLCVCERRLVRLFSSSFPGVEFVSTAPPPQGRLVLPMGSLGRLYRRALADIPGAAFLTPAAAVTARWAERLGPRPERLRVGLSWRGGVRQTRTQQRSLVLSQLTPLLDLPGCEYVSLQYGDVREEVEAMNAGLERPIRLLPREEIDDFEELAGLVRNLDVVVSVQNANVHLSGALGQRCLVMVPHRAEWRYGIRGADMPWYGSVALYRQAKPGSWDPVIASVREALLAD